MVTGLLESRRRAPRRRGGMAASAVVHAAVIALAVVATGQGSVLLDDPAPDRVTWVKPQTPPAPAPPSDAPMRAPGGQPAAAAEPAAPPAPTIPDVSSVVIAGIPPVDLSRGAIDEDALRRRGLGAAGGVLGGTGQGGGSPDAPFALHEVERPVVALPGSASPHYPELLRSAGIGGRVLAQFVVDTAGRVERGSLRVLGTTHPQFTAAVEAALPRMRFLPAEAGGRKVRQLVEQPFEFEVR